MWGVKKDGAKVRSEEWGVKTDGAEPCRQKIWSGRVFCPRFCFSALKYERPGTIPPASNSYQGVGGRQPIKDSLGSNRCSMALQFQPPQKLGNIVKNLTKKFSKEFQKKTWLSFNLVLK